MHTSYLTKDLATVSSTVVRAFSDHGSALSRSDVSKVTQVLDVVRPSLLAAGWTIASGARSSDGISLATTTGGRVLADGRHADGAALWVETGRSWTNFAFGQHVMESLMVPDLRHVVIAVVSTYNSQTTYRRCADFLDELFTSARVEWPFASVTLLGF